MKISVIICTHNRAGWLERCLRALAPAAESPADWEVVVVVNACADDTAARAEALRPAFGTRLRIVEEPKPGLSHARNVGAVAAKGCHLIYLDDDAIPAPGWLAAYREYFRKHPDVAGGGGPIEPDWGNLQRPDYWRPEFNVNIGELVLPPNAEIFPEGQLPFGGNMFLQAALLERIGCFNLALGMQGRKLGLAEETDWFQRYRKLGLPIGYVRDALVSHWVNPLNITRAGLRRRAFESGIVSVRVFQAARPERGWLGWGRHVLSAAVRGRLHMGEQVYLLMELGRLWATSTGGASPAAADQKGAP